LNSIKINQLEAFVEVVEHQSFAAVAEIRNINPSSVSRLIQSLEQDLNIKLFQRSTRHLYLTEAGEAYYQSVKPLLEQLELANQQARDINQSIQGRLKVTLPPGYAEEVVLAHLDDFMALHPELNLELLITDVDLDLEKERIDLGIRMGEVTQASWVAKPLQWQKMRLCATSAVLQKYSLKTPEDLLKTPCLQFLPTDQWLFSQKTPINRQTEVSAEPIAVTIDAKIRSTSLYAVHKFCLLGKGVCLLPDWLVAEDIESGHLLEVFNDYEINSKAELLRAWLIFPSRNYLPRKTRLLLDFLYERLK